MDNIYISLVTYTNHDVTKKCLTSLEKIRLEGISLTVMVINNDNNKDFTYNWKGKGAFSVINTGRNLGFSGGHNVGITKALADDADYLLVLNNDTILDKSFLLQLLYAAKKQPNGGVFGPKIYFAKGHEYHQDRYKETEKGKVFWYAGGIIDWKNVLFSHRGVDEVDHGQYNAEEVTDFVSGCCMFLPVSTLKRTGGFDDRYFLYLEDSDLNERIKKSGLKPYYVPSSVIWHENAGSTGGSGSTLQDYFITRNRLLFGFSYAPIRSKIALIRESMGLLRNGRAMQQLGVRDFYLRKFGMGGYKA